MTKQQYLQINDGANRLHLWQLKLPPQLSEAENLVLLKEYSKTKSNSTMQKIVYGNMRCIASFCRQNIQNCNEDVFQKASLFCTEAVKSFRAYQGKPFAVFLDEFLTKKFAKEASHQCQDLSACSNVVNISSFLKAEEKLAQTEENVAQNSQVLANDLGQNLEKNLGQGLFQPSLAQQQRMVQSACDNGRFEEHMDNKLDLQLVLGYVSQLPVVEQLNFQKYFFENETLATLSQMQNLSKQRIEQILQKACSHLAQMYHQGLPTPMEFGRKFVTNSGAVFEQDYVNQVLKAQTVRNQNLFVEFYKNHLSMQQISEKYGLAQNTIRIIVSQIHRAVTGTKYHTGIYKSHRQKTIQTSDGKTYTFADLEPLLPLFDQFEQHIFVEYYKNKKVLVQIAKEHSMTKYQVCKVLKSITEKIVAVKKQENENPLQAIQQNLQNRATLNAKAGGALTFGDVRLFMQKLSAKEQQLFADYFESLQAEKVSDKPNQR